MEKGRGLRRALGRCTAKVIVAICLLASLVPVFQDAGATTRPEYFGLIMHRLDSGTPWPPFKFGSWRIWDAYVGWPDVEPKQGQWNFKRLDLYVNAAQAKGVEVVYPLGLSAPWASARPDEPSGYKPGYAAEPRDLETWRTYVRTIAERYKGRIKYYDVWNEPSDKTYFSGTPEMYVQILRIAYETIKQVDPTAQVIAPGVTGVGRHLEYLDRILALGAKNYLDILGYHFYVPLSTPETMVPLIKQVRQIMAKNGIANKPLWNTETGWWIGNTDGTPDHSMVIKMKWVRVDPQVDAGAYVIRSFVLALSENVERFHWYSWDNLYGLGMRNPTSGEPKAMTKAYEAAVKWLTGWKVTSCKESGLVWVCQLDQAGSKTRWLAWTLGSAAEWRTPKNWNVGQITNVDGETKIVGSGSLVTLSGMPLLFE